MPAQSPTRCLLFRHHRQHHCGTKIRRTSTNDGIAEETKTGRDRCQEEGNPRLTRRTNFAQGTTGLALRKREKVTRGSPSGVTVAAINIPYLSRHCHIIVSNSSLPLQMGQLKQADNPWTLRCLARRERWRTVGLGSAAQFKRQQPALMTHREQNIIAGLVETLSDCGTVVIEVVVVVKVVVKAVAGRVRIGVQYDVFGEKLSHRRKVLN